MAVEDNLDRDTADRRDAKRATIHAAAINEFASRGLTRTSMANIADAAGVSRPALYQYFQNKTDIFASAFIALFDVHVEQALDAMAQPGPLAEQLDNLLQRYEGDLWERLANSPHADELLSAKDDAIARAIDRIVTRLWVAAALHLEQHSGANSSAVSARVDGWVELLRYGPKGFRWDQPSVPAFRRRLTALARSVAADVRST